MLLNYMKKKTKKTNKKGEDLNEEFFLDPRMDKAWIGYTNPKSPTFGNAKRSAINAGYSESYANLITTRDVWLGKVRRSRLFGKAEKVLEETLDMETNLPLIGMFGPIIDKKTKQPILQQNDKLLNIKQNSAKFVTERLGKKEGYSTRTELTGADGAALPTPIYGGREMLK